MKEPQIFVYLKTSEEVLLERIKRRGRDFEQSIERTYLQTITKYYDLFFENLKTNFPKSLLIICETDCKSQYEVCKLVMEEIERIQS